MRKTYSALALVVALLLMVACGETATPTPATGSTTEATATTAMAIDATPTIEATVEASPTAMVEESPTTAATATTGTAAAGETPTVVPVDPQAGFDKIKTRGKLIAGVKYDVPLFGLLNQDLNQPEGFDVDMARMVAQRIFGDANAIQYEEALSRNRIPYLNEERVDVVFSTMTANEERAKQIEFSDAYYVAGQSLLVPANSTIASVNDLAGKSVATAKGSTSEKNIRAFAPEAAVELFDGYAAAVQAMESGRVDAVTTDDIILYGFQKNNPDKFKVVGGQFTQEPYAAGAKKGNTLLIEEVNATIRDMKQSGEWAKLYKKWIGSDPAQVPPQEWSDVYKTAPTIPPVATTPTATP